MQYGMSERLGLMSTASEGTKYLEGQAVADCSQATAALVDQEVQDLLQRAYTDAKTLLERHRALLDEISLYLLEKETITGEELMAYVRAEDTPPEQAPKEN